ncbi:MAG: efflux RND transporter periplasmic adaptor subunit [Bacteroidales bacterium]|nr:efflux RND transporter periplasmic adaptor subunit [Bacteroidales bacterium]
MKKTIIILAVLIIAAGAVGYMFLKKDKTFKIEWETKNIEKGDIDIEITATGTLEAVTKVEVGTQVSGIVSSLYVDFNSKVRKGQVIARLDTTTLAASAFDQRANYNRKRILLNQAKRDYDRTKRLFEEKVVAQIEYDKVLDEYETAASNLVSAEAQLNRALINLNYATITAPIDGIVISKNVEQGQTVASSFNSPTLFTIVNDLTKMQVEASVDEADIGQIKEGQSVIFTVDAFQGEEFNGEVKQIRLEPVIVSNVVNYVVIVDVPNPDMKLMPGMTASITVSIDKREDVLKVPTKALNFNPPEVYLAKLYNELPDSVKQQTEERLVTIKERMESRGISGAQLDQMMQRFRTNAIFGGGQRMGGPGGNRMGQGASGQGGQRPQGGSAQEAGGARNMGSFGQIWIKEGENVRPIRVRTGISDGSFIEVINEDITIESQVVISALYDEEEAQTNQQTNSPFAPQMGRGRR